MMPLWLSGLLIVLALAYLTAVFKGKDSAEKWPNGSRNWKCCSSSGA